METQTGILSRVRQIVLHRPQTHSLPFPTGRIQAVGVDIDQCLTVTGEPQMRILRQALALARLQRYNERCKRDPRLPKIFLVSGRDVRYGQGICNILGVHDWCIAEYGGILYHPVTGEIVENKELDPTTYLRFNEVRKKAERIPDAIPALRLYRWKSVMVTLERIDTAIRMDTLRQLVEFELAAFTDVVDIRASQIAVDIICRGLDKGAGLRFRHESGRALAEPARTLYIDDSMGASDAVMVAGLLGCPSNATKEFANLVRSKGGFVAKRPLREGVVDVLKHYGIRI
ncbi:MAG: hypothetical protein HYS52_01650 [Candidatus Wildermuthbacteria bacterium]|nr:hypothetical protein [Candidatus Wildermuthbacteria bacterium]